MRITFIITNLQIGGAQTFLIRLLESLAKNHEISLFNVNLTSDKSSLSHLLPNGIICEKSFYSSFSFLKRSFKEDLTIAQFKKHVNKFKPDLISSHLFHADLLVRLSNCSVPHVITDHGDYKNESLDFSCRKYNIESADLVIANSTYTSEFLKNSFKVNPIAINYGYSFRGRSTVEINKKKLEIEEDVFVYCMVARGIKEKGWIEAIEAFSMHRFFDSSFFIFIGEGEGVSEARSFAAKNKISNVFFAGYQENPESFLSVADVSVLPSYFESESVGLSLVESIFFGIPVIATDWGGLPQVVKDSRGDCGVLSSIKDGRPDIQSLARSMDYMHEHHFCFRKNTKHCFEKFSMKRCVENYQDCFERTLAEGI